MGAKEDFEREILHEIKHEERDVKFIKNEVDIITRHLIEPEIEHFSNKDINNAFFGAIIIGLTFVFKGLLIQVGMQLPWKNVVFIIIVTLLILTSEIYYVGYERVKNKSQRHFLQFWFKRIVAMYVIAIVVSFFLLYLFGFMLLDISYYNFMKLVFVVAMPCAIGAAIPNMLKPS